MTDEILVIGSMNMDLVVQTDRSPEKGETLIGREFQTVPGGKGANQAVAIGKLKGDVTFIGACGQDRFGDALLSSLQESGVKIDAVSRFEGASGIAVITIESDGDNRIIVIPGANGRLSPEMIDQMEERIQQARIVLLQLEIPLETVLYTIELAHKYGKTIILDPAPAVPLPEHIYSKIDYLLPNEGELNLLLADHHLTTLDEKAEKLLELGVKGVLVTRGAEGSSLYTKDGLQTFEAVQVKAVDTTAAGDSFAGAFALGLQKNWSLEESINFAKIIAALSVTKVGAQSSLPELEQVELFKREKGL